MHPALAHILRYKRPVVAGGTPLSLDGPGAEASGSTATTSVSLSTSLSNNVIVVCLIANGTNASGVSSPTLGPFTRRSAIFSGNNVEVWWAVASSPLVNESITVALAGAGFNTVTAFAVNGAKTSAPWDTNVALPVTGSSDPLSVSTTATNTFIFGTYRLSTGNPTAASPFTAIKLNSDFMLTEYNIYSSPQTSLAVPIGVGVGTSNGGIADAIVQGP